jgi:hypothetical protein
MTGTRKKVLSDYAGRILTFRQPSFFKRNYELFSEDEELGTLQITGAFRCKSVLKILDTQWEIKKESFWKKDIGIYPLGYELPVAVYTPRIFGHGILKLEKGILLFFSHNIWKGISEIKTESAKLLLSAKNRSLWNREREVTIAERNEIIDSKPWILMLLMFIDISRQKHAAAAAA